VNRPAAPLAVAAFCVALWGCGSTITKPVTLDQNSYSLSAEQRVFLSRNRATLDGSPGSQRVTCAEPSPDALKAVAQSLSAQAQAAGYGGGGLSTSSAESAASIGLRTATIQLLRDGLYRICEAYANGALSEFGYALALSNFDEIMIRLISVEGLTGTRQAPQVTIGGGTKSQGKGTSTLDIASAGAPAAAGGTAEGADVDVTSSTETETSSEAQSTQGQIGTITIQTPAGLDAEAVRAVQAIATRTRSEEHAVASACMMWLSYVPAKPHDANHQSLARFCDGLLTGQLAALQAKLGRPPADLLAPATAQPASPQ